MVYFILQPLNSYATQNIKPYFIGVQVACSWIKEQNQNL